MHHSFIQSFNNSFKVPTERHWAEVSMLPTCPKGKLILQRNKLCALKQHANRDERTFVMSGDGPGTPPRTPAPRNTRQIDSWKGMGKRVGMMEIIHSDLSLPLRGRTESVTRTPNPYEEGHESQLLTTILTASPNRPDVKTGASSRHYFSFSLIPKRLSRETNLWPCGVLLPLQG